MYRLSMRKHCFLLLVAVILQWSDAFYFPGVKMRTFDRNSVIKMYVNSLTSSETLLPKEYYSLPFCKPAGGVSYKSENLGEYLTANRVESSAYLIEFLKPVSCKVLCKKIYSPKQVQLLDETVKDSYRINWILDNLPVATKNEDETHELGFPLGKYDADVDRKAQVYNHVLIVIGYHSPPESVNGAGRIVDFAAFPRSLKYDREKHYDGKTETMSTCDSSRDILPPLFLDPKAMSTLDVYWTYSVLWEQSSQDWKTRWDVYFEVGSGNDEVHWFSIINALLIVLLLGGMVGIILIRSLHRDINRYNRVPTEEEREEEREESGWKLVHADVFRPPSKFPMLFCVVIGTGVQLFGMALVTIVFAAVGFLSPSNRGNLMVALVVVFVLMGSVAGYNSARTYKMFKGKHWQRCTLLTAFLFPGAVFSLFFFMNLFVWATGSDAAVPFGSMFVIVLLWFGVSVPLVFAGAWMGYKKPAASFPVATSNIPRPVPLQPWYMTNSVCAVVGGILPFGAIFVEVFFILASVWTNKYYYVFGFLLLSFFILINTCAEITIVLCYFQLCGEDYNWWWRSVIVSGSCGVYVLLYSAYYYVTRLDINNFIGSMLYFSYMSIISGCLFLLTGMVGYFSCSWFTRKIYASIKVD